MSKKKVESVQIRPGVGMLALLSSMNYKPWYALAELVDNALASYLANERKLKKRRYGQDHVTVQIRLDRGAGTIEVEDDAGGISEVDVSRAFRPAEPPPDVSGLAQFGIGMKSAACWYSKKFEVTSTALGEPLRRTVAFDVPEIVEGKIEELPIEQASASVDDHGTTIVMSELHRQMPSGQTLGKVRRYLASIYRDYLRREILVLEVGEEPVEYVEPEILKAPRWDAKEGARSKEWRKDLEISLASGRKVRGWAALRAKGSTSEAGLALLFRGKVVVGAGGPAGDIEGLFRPSEVFGSSNSFVAQRLFGELDVSEMKVAHSKDAILWDGEEEEFLSALRRNLDAGATPLLKMAQNHRVTEVGAKVQEELTRAVESTVEAASRIVEPNLPGPISGQGSPPGTSDGMVSRSFQLKLPGSELDVDFSVVLSKGLSWVRVVSGESSHTIEVDRNHPFMQSFAHLPGQEVEPILRLAAAIGLAEIEVRHAGAPDSGAVRVQLNELLRGPLARTTMQEIEDEAH